MLVRYLTSPLRVALGLPPVYGITLGNRILQIGRYLGIYKGPINFRCKVRTVRAGASLMRLGA